MKSLHLAAVSLVLGAGALSAQATPGTPAKPEGHQAIVALADKITWGPAPAILPPGAKLAVLEGNPAQPGEFTMRLLLPAGYRIPPHYHPVTEHVTVVAGHFRVGMGEKFDRAALNELPVGTFAALSAGMRHYAETQGETIIQLHGTGPWGLTYVNPADDPRATP